MATPNASENEKFVASGFFALRTPLLPFDEFLRWSDGLEAPAFLNDPVGLEKAVVADRSRLRRQLQEVMARSEVREALFIASPALEASFDLWVRDPKTERGQGIEQAMARYFLRLTGRATPFGLCAGCSVGKTGSETRLVLGPRANWQRHTRLDMDYLHALTETLAADPNVRRVFRYRPNSSLYRAAGRLRYAESHLEGKNRTYRLVAVDETDYLSATLDRAREGAPLMDLAAALVDEDITSTEAEEYVVQLIQSQLLVPDIALCLTGREPVHPLIEQFSQHEATASAAKMLAVVRDKLGALDAYGLGNQPERYRAATRLLSDSPAKVELGRFIQVEMVKSAVHSTLGRAPLAEIIRGVELLHRLARPQSFAPDELTLFREAFVARYEEQAIPLAEALDGEIGIGFPVTHASGHDGSPLLQGLDFPAPPERTALWGKRDGLLLRKLTEVLGNGAQEMTIEKVDLAEMSESDLPPLPDAFAMMATIAASSEDALNAGNFRVSLGGSTGPSGAILLGRFCHADPVLHREVEGYLRLEEALHPEAIFAEIVHLPEGRIGNILARPILREYEIPYLGRSGVCPEKQIAVSDLFLKVRDNRLVLFSKRLGREIIPRLTSAHNFAWRGVATYRFLCALQGQDTARIGWDWGILENAAFLPRVTSGKLVLSRARWLTNKQELQGCIKERGARRFAAMQTWRAERRLPRLVALAEADNELPLDLDNALCIETFIDRIKGRNEARLIELFPTPELLCASSPEGRFVHEIIVPFIRTSPATTSQKSYVSHFNTQSTDPSSITRTFPPGSEWLYAKIYTGTATADRILRDVVRPLVEELLGSGAADRWFFIRYGDPDWHLRLRFHGAPDRLREKALPALEAAVTPLLQDGRIWRLQLDTYTREVERYGGPEGIVLAEQIFQADSEAVLEIIQCLDPGDAGLDERWRLTLRGVDMLCQDFALDGPSKLALIRKVRKGFAREMRLDADLKAQIGEKFRKERKELEALLDPKNDVQSALSPGLEIFRRRSARLAPIVAEVNAAKASDGLSVSIEELVLSCIHMHMNRLLRSAHRAHELVVYDYLARIYDTQIARAKVDPGMGE
jgi:thiopeptide-type bacteriocin biosynthesis protein